MKGDFRITWHKNYNELTEFIPQVSASVRNCVRSDTPQISGLYWTVNGPLLKWARLERDLEQLLIHPIIIHEKVQDQFKMR